MNRVTPHRVLLRWVFLEAASCLVIVLGVVSCGPSSAGISLEFPLRFSATEAGTQELWSTLPKGLYGIDYVLDGGKEGIRPEDMRVTYSVSVKNKGVVCSGSLTPGPALSSERGRSDSTFQVSAGDILHIEFTLPACPDPTSVKGTVRIQAITGR
jgi:hypothetical protein